MSRFFCSEIANFSRGVVGRVRIASMICYCNQSKLSFFLHPFMEHLGNLSMASQTYLHPMIRDSIPEALKQCAPESKRIRHSF